VARQIEVVLCIGLLVCHYNACAVLARDTLCGIGGAMVDDQDFGAGKQGFEEAFERITVPLECTTKRNAGTEKIKP
jgi:hypothetical protein